MEESNVIEVDFGTGVGIVRFKDHADFREALERERQAFSPLLGTASTGFDNFWSGNTGLMGEYMRVVDNDKARVARQLASNWGSSVRRGDLLYSGSLRGTFLVGLAKEQATEAVGAATYFFGGSLSTKDARLVAGVTRAVLFDLGLSDLDARKSAFSSLGETWRAVFKNIADQQEVELQRQQAALTDFLKRSGEDLDDHRRASGTVIKAATDNFNEAVNRLGDLEKTYNNKLALQAPASYWEEQATRHAKYALGWGWAFAVALVAGGAMMTGLLAELLQSEKPPAWRIGAAITLAALVVWGIRVLAKLLFMNLHLAADARERKTLIVTYLAMMRDSSSMTKDERLLMLGPLFMRSAAASGGADDLSPNIVQDLISKVKA
jgi:hypothetical protein